MEVFYVSGLVCLPVSVHLSFLCISQRGYTLLVGS